MRDTADFAGVAFRRPQLDLRADAFKRATCFDTAKGALPDGYEIPSGFAPCFFVPLVAFDVLRPLLHPEFDVRLRHSRVFAPVPVPEATTHVDDCFRLGDYNVRFALKPLVAHSESPAASKQPFTDKDFRQSILASNLCHQTATLFRGQFIHNCRSNVRIHCRASRLAVCRAEAQLR